MVKVAEYEGVVLDDGHLSLPEKIKSRLKLQPQVVLKVKISRKDSPKENITQAWDVLVSMGHYAGEGKLVSASERHDHYLYNKSSE